MSEDHKKDEETNIEDIDIKARGTSEINLKIEEDKNIENKEFRQTVYHAKNEGLIQCSDLNKNNIPVRKIIEYLEDKDISAGKEFGLGIDFIPKSTNVSIN